MTGNGACFPHFKINLYYTYYNVAQHHAIDMTYTVSTFIRFGWVVDVEEEI